MRPRLLFASVLAISFLAVTPAGAVDPKPVATGTLTPSAPAPPPVPDDATPDSPRASMRRFMGLCRAGEYGEAAEYLDLTEAQKRDGAQYARRLKAVIDAQIWIKLDQISGKPWGDASDKLPAGVEEIGTVPGPNGPEPVRLVRRHHQPDGVRWVFSRNTVERINDWYGRLRDRWMRDYLPERLLRPGPQEMLWWQWIAFPVLFVLALGAGKVLGWCTRKAIGRIVLRTKATWDDALLSRLGAPLTLVWAVVAVHLALPRLALYPPAEAFMERVVQAGLYVAALWFVERSIEIGGARLLGRQGTQTNPAARSLVPLGTRALKVAVFVVAIIATLSALGYPVASLWAGLGIGGVAIALAAQKTVENLFGSLSIGVDQPFRVGDYITVDGLVTGTVESIGLRSTRIRTLDRTLVTIPNGKLADMRVESYTQRDRIKLGCVLQLERDTSVATMRATLEGIRALLKAHPKIWPDMNVSLARIGNDSLDIEVLAWFQTTVWNEFTPMREDILLGMIEVIEKAGAKLAFPTRAIRLDGGAPPS